MKTSPVFFCNTPFHVVMAENIIRQKKISEFFLIYICFESKEKASYYYARLSEKAIDSKFLFVKRPGLLCFIKFLLVFFEFIGWKKRKYHAFFANSKVPHNRYISMLLGVEKYSFFDDGVGTIVDRVHFVDTDENHFSKIFFKVFSRRYCYANFMKNAEVFLSCFDKKPVYDLSVEKVEIKYSDNDLPAEVKQLFSKKHKNTVLLGSCFPASCSEGSRLCFYSTIADKYRIDYFLPHPRSGDVPLLFEHTRMKFIATDRIAEELFILLSVEHAFNLYGFGSTSLYLLEDYPEIECRSVDEIDMDNFFKLQCE